MMNEQSKKTLENLSRTNVYYWGVFLFIIVLDSLGTLKGTGTFGVALFGLAGLGFIFSSVAFYEIHKVLRLETNEPYGSKMMDGVVLLGFVLVAVLVGIKLFHYVVEAASLRGV